MSSSLPFLKLIFVLAPICDCMEYFLPFTVCSFSWVLINAGQLVFVLEHMLKISSNRVHHLKRDGHLLHILRIFLVYQPLVYCFYNCFLKLLGFNQINSWEPPLHLFSVVLHSGRRQDLFHWRLTQCVPGLRSNEPRFSPSRVETLV